MFVASVLSVVGHLHVFAVEILAVGAFQGLAPAFHPSIAQEKDALAAVPHAQNHGGIVVGIGGEVVGHTQNLQVHAIEVVFAAGLLDVCHLGQLAVV